MMITVKHDAALLEHPAPLPATADAFKAFGVSLPLVHAIFPILKKQF